MHSVVLSNRNIPLLILGNLRRKFYSTKELKETLIQKVNEHREVVEKFRIEHGKRKIADITVNMIYGGMRGLKALIWETSQLDPYKGIMFRGHTIPDLQTKLPKAKKGCSPLPEGLFWLMLTGDIPRKEQVDGLSRELSDRAILPSHVISLLSNMPHIVHPMVQFSSAIIALSTESQFAKAYDDGVKKNTYWEYVLEDSLDLIAKLPVIAALIYKNTFKDGASIGLIDTSKDWSYNFAKMLGFNNAEFIEAIRLYLTIHADHEGGNVSAHTTHLVGSALSDPFLAFASGINGLAGPLHGLANQEVLIWLQELQKAVGADPSEDKIRAFVKENLNKGKIIPGYGHAVLRTTDPRFLCQQEYANLYIPDDPLVKLVDKVYKVVPPILQASGKVRNPWPNVDAYSGCLLNYYGLTEMKYYTVMFGMSRALGVLASLIWSRALCFPIERPKSVTTKELMSMIQNT